MSLGARAHHAEGRQEALDEGAPAVMGATTPSAESAALAASIDAWRAVPSYEGAGRRAQGASRRVPWARGAGRGAP